MNFPDFEKNKLIDITKNLTINSYLVKNIIINDELLEDIVSFHINCKENSLNVISHFCYSIKKLKNKLNELSIDDSKIIDIIFNLIFKNNIYEYEFNKQISKKILLRFIIIK